MSQMVVPQIMNRRVITGVCSVCQLDRDIYHRVELKRAGRVLVQYCIECFE